MSNLLLSYEYAVNKEPILESDLDKLTSEGLVEIEDHQGLYKINGEWFNYFTCKLTPKGDKLIRLRLQGG